MSRLRLIVDNVIEEVEENEEYFNNEETRYGDTNNNLIVSHINQDPSHLPWIEKYRPQKLSDIVEHVDIIEALQGYIENKFLPHLLFYGPPGTGKTSMIVATANELYGKNSKYMVLELNASDERGIDVVRKRIKTFVMAKSLSFDNDMEGLFKLVILDEIDAMTPDAQAILKKLVEVHTANVRFCLICNFIQKIDPALQSRCKTFRFAPLSKKNIIPKINTICEIEKLNVTSGATEIIIRKSNGDMRKILNQLQAISMAYEVINEENLNKFFGYPSDKIIDNIIANAANLKFSEAYDSIINIKMIEGVSIIDVISGIHILLEGMIITRKSNNSVIKKMSLNQITKLILMLKQIEINQNISTNENIQVAALVSAFKLSMDVSEKK